MTYRECMVELVSSSDWQRGALVGLGSGALLVMLLESASTLHIIGVDHFVRIDRRQRICSAVSAQYSDRCVIIEAKSAQAAAGVGDRSLDFVWIDAGHKYGCVRADLRAWWPKVRSGGWFGGHDFCPDYPGVMQAVEEKFGQVSVSSEHVWSVRK